MKKFIAMASALLSTGVVLSHPNHATMTYTSLFDWVGHYLNSGYHLVVMAVVMAVLMGLSWGLRTRHRLWSALMGAGSLGAMASMIWTFT